MADELIKQLQDELKRKDEQLQQQAEQLKRKDRELSEVKLENEDLQKKMKLKSRQSMSYSHIGTEFVDSAKVINVVSSLSQVDDSVIKKLWLKCLSLRKKVISSRDYDKPESTYQGILDKLLPMMLQELGNKSLVYKPQIHLFQPRFKPDSLVCPANIIHPNWYDIVTLFEYKLPERTINSGIGQTVSYMSVALEKQASFGRNFMYSMFTDCVSISFLSLRDGDPFMDGNHDFLNLNESYTVGFAKLCYLMNASPENLGYIKPPTEIQLNNQKFPVIEVLGVGGEAKVFHCKYNGEDVAVKIPSYKTLSNLLTLRRETENIQLLRNVPALQSIVPTPKAIYPNGLVLSPVGESLSKIEAQTPEQVKDLLLKLLDAVQLLHQNGFAHNDLRFDNVIVHEGELIIIDWQSLSEVGKPIPVYRSALPLLPDRIIMHLLSSDPSSANLMTDVHDDLEQIFYIMLNWKDGDYDWMYKVKKAMKTSEHTTDLYLKIHSCRQELLRKMSFLGLKKKRLSYILFIKDGLRQVLQHLPRAEEGQNLSIQHLSL